MTFVPVDIDYRADGHIGKPIRVAILGCGPAGLIAAHAVNTCGVTDFGILSVKRPSPLYGAQYLHAPIPGIYMPDPVRVEYKLNGLSEIYRDRVYGRDWEGSVSADDLEESHDAWDIRATYRSLWACYEDYIANLQVRPFDIGPISRTVDLLINTIPLPALCLLGHQFRSAKIWAAGEAPELGIRLPYQCPPNTVVLNGHRGSPAWYRMSNVFGHKTVEWPGAVPKPPIRSVATATKPLSNNCDCHTGMLRVGRYGAWSKGVLAHQVFGQVREAVLKTREAA